MSFEQCTVREENGKLVAQTEKFTSVREIQGDEMVEVSGLLALIVAERRKSGFEVMFSVCLCFLTLADHHCR